MNASIGTGMPEYDVIGNNKMAGGIPGIGEGLAVEDLSKADESQHAKSEPKAPKRIVVPKKRQDKIQVSFRSINPDNDSYEGSLEN